MNETTFAYDKEQCIRTRTTGWDYLENLNFWVCKLKDARETVMENSLIP